MKVKKANSSPDKVVIERCLDSVLHEPNLLTYNTVAIIIMHLLGATTTKHY